MLSRAGAQEKAAQKNVRKAARQLLKLLSPKRKKASRAETDAELRSLGCFEQAHADVIHEVLAWAQTQKQRAADGGRVSTSGAVELFDDEVDALPTRARLSPDEVVAFITAEAHLFQDVFVE
eukprot:COSAG01_NODE_792_length_13554_cov_13.811891_7_plen_122_part_00